MKFAILAAALGSVMSLAAVSNPARAGTILFNTYSPGNTDILTITPFPLTNNVNNQPVATNNPVNINFTMVEPATVKGFFFQAWEWRNPGTFNIAWFVNNVQVGSTFLTPAPAETQAVLTNVEFDFGGTKELFANDAIRVNFSRVASMSGSSSTAMRLNVTTDSVAPIAVASGAGGNLVTPFAFHLVPEPAAWPAAALAAGAAAAWHARRRAARG